MKFSISSRRKPSLDLGTEVGTNQPVDCSTALLSTHMHILGPPGSGKTRFLLSLFQQLVRQPEATVILFNVKGDLGTMARDWCLGRGYANRLLWFDPADSDIVMGYNPLRPNGLSVATQAKNVREAIRASWGQRSFDETAQLARFLYLTLFVVRELDFTLTEALRLLRPESSVREAMLPAIQDPYIREEFQYLDSLRGARQDELLASTLARLESFVLDPSIRRIITQQAHTLDIEEVMRRKQVLILNFEQYKPLALDDVKLLGRFIINDVVTHAFQRPRTERTPVYLLLDECQTIATADLCRALDQGRELGLHCVLANQYLEQLKLEEASGLLYHSVMECARTKVLFGGLSTMELEVMTPELMIDRYDPWRVKDEIRTLESEPVESTRVVFGEGQSSTRDYGESTAISRSTSYGYTEGKETTHGRAAGVSLKTGTSTSQGVTESTTRSNAYTRGHTQSIGTADSLARDRGWTTQESIGETRNAQANIATLGSQALYRSKQQSAGLSDSISTAHSDSVSSSDSDSESESLSFGSAQTITYGVQTSLGSSRSMSRSVGRSLSTSKASEYGTTRTRSRGISIGHSTSRSVVPWYEYRNRWVVSSRQFLTREEQMTLALQQLRSQPKAHFFIKTANHQGIFVRAPFIKTPWISNRTLTEGMARVYQQPKYATVDQIHAEEVERAHRLIQLAYNDEDGPDHEHADLPNLLQGAQAIIPIPRPTNRRSLKRKHPSVNLFESIKRKAE